MGFRDPAPAVPRLESEMLQGEPLLNTVHAGDCLEVMADWPDGLADMCYVALPATGAWRWDQAAADRIDRIQRRPRRTGHDAVLGLHIVLGDVCTMAYLSFVAERLPGLIRVLKPAGSLCLVAHAADGHYAKVLLDGFLGAPNFRGEIAWRPGARMASGAAKATGPHCGSAVWYVKDNDYAGGLGWLRPIVTAPVDEPLADGPETSQALARRVIATTTRPGDVVLDPFHGDGAAAVAARQLGRRSIGIDTLAPRVPWHP